MTENDFIIAVQELIVRMAEKWPDGYIEELLSNAYNEWYDEKYPRNEEND
jgi:hypothetical protein